MALPAAGWVLHRQEAYIRRQEGVITPQKLSNVHYTQLIFDYVH